MTLGIDKAARNDNLRLFRRLFLLTLQSHKLDAIEVDGEWRVID